MTIDCPGCAKTLALTDDLAGRRVRCPACQQVFQVPSSMPGAVTAAPNPVPAAARKSASLPPPDAVTDAVPTRKRATRSCPECGESLAAGTGKCSGCGWTSDQLVVKVPRAASRLAASAGGAAGRCYVDIRGDEVDLNEEVEKRLGKLILTEQLDLHIMDEEEPLPEELGPNDLVISGKVTLCDHGSRFMRYFATFITIFGPGSCQLEVDVEIETATGETRRVKTSVRQAIGVFGGDSDALMKLNVQIVAKRIATGAARQATGRSFLNAHAYSCAYWSLGLGLASLVPFLGVLLGLIGLGLGLPALLTISRRKLPRGKAAALAGILLACCGLIVTAGTIWLVGHM